MPRMLALLVLLTPLSAVAANDGSNDYPTDAYTGDRWHVWFVLDRDPRGRNNRVAFLGLQNNMRPRYNKAQRVAGVQESEGERLTVRGMGSPFGFWGLDSWNSRPFHVSF